MRIGLFFGSFNPIHIGHLIIANIIADSDEVDQVWFVVSPLNPFKKSSKSLIHEFDRYDMVEAASMDSYNLKVTDVEFNLPKPSYTIDTLAYLSDKHPEDLFKLIIGEDNLESFPKWKNHQQILSQYGLLVYPRPMAANPQLFTHSKVKVIDAPKIDISATFIRERISKNKSVKYLIPAGVWELIEKRKLYH